ncbi:helix-turn-helix domain-containing protein [Flammeovirga yaeyamensis]|uniref:Helix-turn-helix domain-containing protein n=1 Tax=Flammeovirga yaeyamensis TaxID=367791 RepID=A0AAX1N2C4_9BACT|nr:AraC family transcriptional regulator [Flammeovirga yaeyamensis]MBB3698227.1 AraC-like DNA-binding protein [Flammeovirga yaeyamensis]NMF34418.1 helix-turn-helix transcriptional regulator [Flammeovirga yaeyamensis]QWG01397.1 helix-turn-helix domain-containing protein [Flammeovirga yaeyamensis]
MVESGTSILFEDFLEKYSLIDCDKEEFGLKILKATSKSSNRNGNYLRISFAHLVVHHFTWELQEPMVIDLSCAENGIFFHTGNGHIILNKEKLSSQMAQLFTKSDLEITLLPNQNQFTFIEFQQDYFDQRLLHPSLKQMVLDLFDQKSTPFKIKKNISLLLDDITTNQKRGLCQLMYLNGKIFEILSEISDQFTHYESDAQQQFEPQMAKVKQLIDENLHIQYSINDLAKSVGINTSYLKKYFKEIYEETIFEYSTRKRMEYAKNLLSTTNLSISIISEKVGYQHSAHFSYAFKKNMDMTPNQFRKKMI